VPFGGARRASCNRGACQPVLSAESGWDVAGSAGAGAALAAVTCASHWSHAVIDANMNTFDQRRPPALNLLRLTTRVRPQ